MVVMDREVYIGKAEELLNQTTFKTILADPTIRHKNKLISLLKNIKAEGGIKTLHIKECSPQGQDPQIL